MSCCILTQVDAKRRDKGAGRGQICCKEAIQIVKLLSPPILLTKVCAVLVTQPVESPALRTPSLDHRFPRISRADRLQSASYVSQPSSHHAFSCHEPPNDGNTTHTL